MIHIRTLKVYQLVCFWQFFYQTKLSSTILSSTRHEDFCTTQLHSFSQLEDRNKMKKTIWKRFLFLLEYLVNNVTAHTNTNRTKTLLWLKMVRFQTTERNLSVLVSTNVRIQITEIPWKSRWVSDLATFLNNWHKAFSGAVKRWTNLTVRIFFISFLTGKKLKMRWHSAILAAYQFQEHSWGYCDGKIKWIYITWQQNSCHRCSVRVNHKDLIMSVSCEE